MDDPLERLDRHVLERADLRRRCVGRRVDRRGVDQQVGNAPVDLDERERRLDLGAVGDVAFVHADSSVLHRRQQSRCPRARLGLEIEDRDPHGPRSQCSRKLGTELPHPAGDDGDTAGEVEERIAHCAIVTLTDRRPLAPLCAPRRRRADGVRSPAMGGALLLAAAVGLLVCVGWYLTGALGIGSFALRLLAAYPAAWVGLVVAAALLSVPGWMSRWSLLAAVGALAVVAFVLDRRRRSLRGSSFPPGWNEALSDHVVLTLAIAVAAAGIYLAAVAFLTTPNDWDGLTYHETRALLWDQQGRVGYVPAGNDPRLDGNPPVSEIGLYLAMLVPRTERFAALPQFVALWASLLAVVLLGRRLGLSRQAATYGGLVFATSRLFSCTAPRS